MQWNTHERNKYGKQRAKLNPWMVENKINQARSRLYRSQTLEVNTRSKTLAEIYTMHSFAPFWNRLHRSLISKCFANFAETLLDFADCLPHCLPILPEFHQHCAWYQN